MFKLLLLMVIGGLMLDQIAYDGAGRKRLVAQAVAEANWLGQTGDRSFRMPN